MNRLKRPIRWITRHHWLIQGERPTTLYADNLKTRDSILYYQCQVCGKWHEVEAVNLDNMPVEDLVK